MTILHQFYIKLCIQLYYLNYLDSKQQGKLLNFVHISTNQRITPELKISHVRRMVINHLIENIDQIYVSQQHIYNLVLIQSPYFIQKSFIHVL